MQKTITIPSRKDNSENNIEEDKPNIDWQTLRNVKIQQIIQPNQ